MKQTCSSVEISPGPNHAATIAELAFRSTFESVSPVEVCGKDECVPARAHPWFDETELYEPYSDHFNGTYFDEIYYARSGEYPD